MTALNYSAGTVSLTNGSTLVTGIDTAWATALLKGGEIFVQAPGNPLPIATIDSDTQITAALKWTGATGVYDYVLRIGTAYDQQIAKNAEILARLLAEIDAGTVWKYDASGDTAGRDFYDNRTKDFGYLDISGEQAVLWVKASNNPGDWSGPFAYGIGPIGPPPSLTFSPVVTGGPGTPASLVTTGSGPYNLAFTIPAGLTGIRWRGVYGAGVSYLERDAVSDNGSTWLALQDTIGNAPPVLPSTANAFWELIASKGLDGTGTGDVVGPAEADDGALVIFSGTTGKTLAKGPLPTSFASSEQGGRADSALQSIVAGENITIDSTDPRNPVVSSAGSPGLWITQAIERWKALKRAARVYYGGLNAAMATTISGGTTSAGRTFALDTVTRRIRQDGEIRSVKFTLANIGGNGLTEVLKFKVLRKSGAVYTLVSESELITPAAVTTRQTVRLANPLTCRPGDVVAVWIKGFASNPVLFRSGAVVGESLRYINGETLSNTWTDFSDSAIDLQMEGIPPLVVATGDSIITGHNTANWWYTHYEAGPAGELTSSPINQTRSRIPTLEYQNFSQGNSNWTDVLAKAAAISEVGARAVVVACGVNDVGLDRTWTEIKADMDAFKAAMPAGTLLFICEILPYTTSTDTRAAAIRTINANYAAWCSENDAVLIPTHDSMGEIRTSTGQLDDLFPGYSYDGVHLTKSGADELGSLIADGLRSVLWEDGI